MNRRLSGISVSLLLIVVGVAALAVAADVEEDLGLQWLFVTRGPIEPPDNVVIVAIDALSARALALPDKPRDWPRSLHGEIVRYLASAGARVIAFDLTFERPGAGDDGFNDRALAAAIGRAGNVLVTDSLLKEVVPLADSKGATNGSIVIERPVSPIEGVAQSVLAHAPFLLPKGPRVNAYWTFLGTAGNTPTIPVLANHFYAAVAVPDFSALLDAVSIGGARVEDAIDPSLSQADVRLGTIRGIRARVATIPDAREALLRSLKRVPEAKLTPARRRAVESLVKMYTSGEMAYLNFYGPPRHIMTVPYARVLESARGTTQNPLARDLFRDKAVFVGYSASGEGVDSLHDDYPTVFSETSGRDISGVEIQATAFANAWQGRAIEPAPPAWRFLAVAAWGLLLGLICSFARPVRATIAIFVLSSILLWLVYRQFADTEAWWPSIVPIGVQVPLALLACIWLNYQETTREREAVKRAFARFLPSSVVDQLARNVGAVTATNRVVFGACLATDAEKYTTLAEQTEPGKLGELMNDYYADLFVPVERTGGVVIDVVGDSMVAVWAGSLSEAQLRRNACESALEIVSGFERARAPESGRFVLPTRLGLHSGEMLIGSVGASRHFEYRAVGDIVNTSSRIQALNKTLGTRLLASQATVEGLEHLAVRPLGSFLLPGKLTPVGVVELIARREQLSTEKSDALSAFALALSAYQTGSWEQAATQWAEILRATPDDGPSRFYLSHCLRLIRGAAKVGWSPTIRIESASHRVDESPND